MNNSSIDDALPILRDNLDDIHTVSEWADAVGYSRGHFTHLIHQEFSETPYQIICREKYRKIFQQVRDNPKCKGLIIARKTGFSDVKGMYKFLKNHFGTTLTTLRKKALTGNEEQIEQIR